MGYFCFVPLSTWITVSQPFMYSFDFLWVPCFSGHRSFAQTTYSFFVELPDIWCSVAQSCPILYDLMDCNKPGFPVLHYLPDLFKLRSIESVMPSNHLILCHPLLLCRSLLLLPSIFPSISLVLGRHARSHPAEIISTSSSSLLVMHGGIIFSFFLHECI